VTSQRYILWPNIGQGEIADLVTAQVFPFHSSINKWQIKRERET